MYIEMENKPCHPPDLCATTYCMHLSYPLPGQLILGVQGGKHLTLHAVVDGVDHRQLRQHGAALLLEPGLLTHRLMIIHHQMS